MRARVNSSSGSAGVATSVRAAASAASRLAGRGVVGDALTKGRFVDAQLGRVVREFSVEVGAQCEKDVEIRWLSHDQDLGRPGPVGSSRDRAPARPDHRAIRDRTVPIGMDSVSAISE